MNTTDAGRLGEIKAMASLTQQGWYPFSDLSGKCPVDIIAWKDGVTKTFQVKSTGRVGPSGKYVVGIGTVRPNRTGVVRKMFDTESVDYLAVYVIPLDKMYFIPASDVRSGKELTLQAEHEIDLIIE